MHTGEVLGMLCTHASWQGTLATHALQGHLPSLSPTPAYSTSTLASLPSMQVVPGLPMTRSVKIMRRVLRKVAEDQPDQLGDISMLANSAVV